SGPYTVTRSTSVVRLAMAYPSGGYFATSTLRGTDLSGAVIGTSTSTTEGVTSTLWRGPFSPYTCNATDRETVSVDPLTLTTPLTAVTSSRSDSEPRTNTFVGLITGSPALKPLGRSPTRSTCTGISSCCFSSRVTLTVLGSVSTLTPSGKPDHLTGMPRCLPGPRPLKSI